MCARSDGISVADSARFFDETLFRHPAPERVHLRTCLRRSFPVFVGLLMASIPKGDETTPYGAGLVSGAP